MAIVQKKGRYYLVTYFTDPRDGKRRQRWESTGESDRDKAEAWVARHNAPAGHGDAMTFADAWEFFTRHHGLEPEAGRKTSTGYRKAKSWEHFCNWMGSERKSIRFMHEVTYQHAMDYCRELRRTVSAHTYNLELAKLREIFDKLEQPAGLTANPFRAVPTAKRVRHRPYKCLSDPELRRILEAAPGAWKVAIVIAMHTGLDFADIRALRWADIVDTPTGPVIHKTRRKVQFTGTAPMVIAVHPRLAALLDTLPRDGEYVLPHKFQTRGCEGEFPELLRTAKIEAEGYTLGFHCLRVTFCTRLEAAGVSAEHRAKLMGHSSPSMTALYSRDVDQARAAVSQLTYEVGE